MSNIHQTPIAPQRAALPHSPPESEYQNLSDVDTTTSSLIPLNPRNSPTTQAAPAAVQDEEEKRCWICYTSDSEEDSPKSDWKSPCKCTLVAHESCLLDWIADLQRSGQSGSSKISCPQCKTPIRLRQEKSVVLELTEVVGRAVGKVVPVLILAGVGSVIFVGCTVYGVNTIYTVCGPAYANQILLGPDSEFSWTWRLSVGLPLIPFVLIASRTRTFESALPVLPFIFFCHSDPLHLTLPPSPAITLAVLPYLRGAYNSLWNRYIRPHEERWIKDVTPTYAIDLENAAAAEEAAAAAAPRRNRRRGREDEDDGLQNNAGWDREVRFENHNIIVQGSNITNMILGALLWPSIARAVGQNILGKWPKAWGGDGIRRWLPEGVVRNVVGGLMVVVLKDFISLYCKYKRAQQFRTRKVMNYSEVRKAKVRAAAEAMGKR
ncbi:hypothetical protein RUND412_007717 [Rhizina undulata]